MNFKCHPFNEDKESMKCSAYIRSVSDDQHEILRNIATLYTDGAFDLDPTYGSGSFYKNGVPEPSIKSDIMPKRPGVRKCDCRKLDFLTGCVNSIVFDPPFVHAHGKASLIGIRFGSFKSQRELGEFYLSSMTKFYRILRRRGVLVFKCQDIVESGKQVWNHCKIWDMANRIGFIAEDFFVLVAKHRLKGHNHGRQVHARKFHSYFWVFRKIEIKG